jgi:hypothetical protein
VSSYIQSWRGKNGSTKAGGTLPPEFADAYPTLFAVLCGEVEGEGVGSRAPKATINLFEEGGKLKFCVCPKEGVEVAFGCFADPVKGLDDLESQLAAQRFEWKRGSKRASS